MATQDEYKKALIKDIEKRLTPDERKKFKENMDVYLPGMLAAIDVVRDYAKDRAEIEQLEAVAKNIAQKMEQKERTAKNMSQSVVDKVKEDYGKEQKAKKAKKGQPETAPTYSEAPRK
jgi:cell division protein ZapA (FtsZ GTPase activity inhibitor)